MPDTGESSHAIRSVLFTNEFRGYNVDEVDTALEALAQQVDDGRPVKQADVMGLSFSRRLRGYRRTEVDAFIRSLALPIR
jgi:DivIVA domain-containing protein